MLHRVGYRQGDELRSVAHRLSFAEMVVPYRDPTPDHVRRTAYDIGEWGLGVMTTSLELGCDCLGEIRYLDAVLPDTSGEPSVIRNAICIHEEDAAILWKHIDDRAGPAVRRMRRLVVSAHVTVANYEYLIYWRFYEDGNIECEVRATGIMVTTPFAGDTPPPYGTVVDTQTYAPIHQHFIVARMDMEIDGPDNTVVMSETAQLPIGRGQPLRAGADPAQRAAAHRGRGQAGLLLGHPARLEDHQPEPAQQGRHAGGLQAGARCGVPAHDRRGLTGAEPGPGAQAHALGDPARRGGALAVR